ncbi:hypothetical protein [Aliikangiella coralliicola]|uniref:Uncharacterized protein n=1 Tax=Aliikangiella coralliicola TaxID=2592383 RepID=A0A545UDM8_9GAMM|nr:hypothetical protein [Aliikangiella coralliicola]TQV87566.1 hypothetical protein FLL46_11890 [Aliikangiella coralliicola]
MANNLKTISISSNESLQSIEDFIEKVSSGTQYKIRLPSRLNTRGALGIEVAVIQLIGTWLKSSKYKKILHSYQRPQPEDFKGLCSTIYGIAGLSLVDEVWDIEKSYVNKGLALEEAKLSIEKLRNKKFEESFTSRYFGIPCIKTPSYDREFDMPVYNKKKGDAEVIESGPFESLLKGVLDYVIGGKSRVKRLNNRIGVGELSELLWESFKNTHDHGRIEENGNELSSNFRGMIVQQQDLTSEYFDIWCGDKPTLKQKLFRESCFSKNMKSHILDISVVDLGAGIIELAKVKSRLEDSKEILLWCLEDGKSRLSGSSRGEGFTKILNKVAENKGWIRIRTGNLLLEKTFHGTSQGIDISDIVIVGNRVAGTSLHISIPLNNNTNKGEC